MPSSKVRVTTATNPVNAKLKSVQVSKGEGEGGGRGHQKYFMGSLFDPICTIYSSVISHNSPLINSTKILVKWV